MKVIKVMDFINKLKEIGYDENTKLTFSCIDGNTGEWYTIPFKQINYGEELTGEKYKKDFIDLEVDVDSAREYIKDKSRAEIDEMLEDIKQALYKWENK